MRCENPRDLNIEEILYAWGVWSRSGVLPKQPRSPVAPLSVRDKDDSMPISVELAERVDAAMLLLKARYPKVAAVLLSRYLYGNYDDKDVGRRCKTSERSVRAWRTQGHMFIEARVL